AVVMATSSVAVEEAVEALVSLGYSAIEAKRWIRSIPNYEEKTAEELLRLSLKQFGL
ncbi:MAG: Holliday junction branch migration protein RuvA, partial [Oribacterium sinus]|nr:Holliday junction branch migration protein RuvA [Oribacterium sinus]